MTGTKNIMCHFHAQGKCRKGSACPFSHDLTRDDSLVCKYFLMGHCTYGDRCHFDHVRPSATPPILTPEAHSQRASNGAAARESAPLATRNAAAATTAAPAAEAGASRMQVLQPGGVVESNSDAASAACAARPGSAWKVPPTAVLAGSGGADLSVRSGNGAVEGALEAEHAGEDPGGGVVRREGAFSLFDNNVDLADPWEMAAAPRRADQPDPAADLASVPLCDDFLTQGWCCRGDGCAFVHGDLCPCCETYALHPHNAEARDAHERDCLEALHEQHRLALSAELECVVCMERVLSHSMPANRKFGLMACEHVFCLGCIRSWRGNQEADLDRAVRTCPVCRTRTNFVTPSRFWPTSQEEKDEIINGYKEKLSSIHCRHFDFGRGKCPFSTSCFYRHEYEDGTLQDRDAPLGLRTVLTGDEDGQPQVLQPINLGRFLDDPAAQRLLRRPARR